MREEIEALINEKLDKVDPLLVDFYSNKNTKNGLNIKIENQNKNTEEKKRKKLLEKVNTLSKNNPEIIYDQNISIEDLEKIINKYKKKKEI